MWRGVKENEVHCKAGKMKESTSREWRCPPFFFFYFFHCSSADVVDALALKEGSKEKRERKTCIDDEHVVGRSGW